MDKSKTTGNSPLGCSSLILNSPINNQQIGSICKDKLRDLSPIADKICEVPGSICDVISSLTGNETENEIKTSQFQIVELSKFHKLSRLSNG